MTYPPNEGNPPWIDWALREVGQREIVGPTHNSRVLYYHSFCRLHAQDDETPWCAAFVCAALENSGVRSTRSARAADYATWGLPCELKDGAIVVFSKHDPDAKGSGHVGFYWRGKCLGGNQRNRVGLDDRDWSKVVAVRWPAF